MNKYYCYLIYSLKLKKTYIGITNNLTKRIKQHNHEIKGGAKSTRGDCNWKYYIIIGNFLHKQDACRFEWYWKHQKNNKNKWIKTKSSIINKLNRLINLLVDNKWHYLLIFSNSAS